ncbi:uncharacterized protein LOC107021959 [Solanum pennellii]|uniref:Uncharacterized protein LOC107021959 n=1 Tax=Solanum pennellii TaxID=28526 RepID=A0ABM1GZG8_SOLPN|nr:uncharacterized protein LOC107021959 [Solanum pennellii]
MEGFDSMMRVAFQLIRIVRMILVVLEAVSGLAVHWRKSCIYPIKEVTQIQALANVLGCRIEKLPTVYLGTLLGNNHKELVIWDGIIEKTEKKLENWKSQYLSFGVRTILINSVLDSLPTYVMSLFPMPVKVEEILDILRRDFLWSGIKEGKRIHLVKWQTALLSRSSVGIRDQNHDGTSRGNLWTME